MNTTRRSVITKYTQTQRVDNRQVRRKISSESSQQFAVYFLLGFLMTLGLIFNGWVRWKQTEITYRINQTSIQRKQLEEKKKLYRTQIVQLQTPTRVEAVARDMLGMHEIQPEQIINVVGAQR